ncbi:pyruvate kinase [Rickettsiella grylli]|uniref:Pyruvate kinase n=1 Tax=Rickettsiella grylli TaxID=59196 RepID=A8PKZ4_9COXI|nr:pyruvate kinase [Rickettsiella grylli]EDP46430.1 pyruvate kinase [Rickettsiella grylli]
MKRFKRTKIVATLGPATDSVAVLQKMIAAGLDVVRLNFSHGKADDHIKRADYVRKYAKAANREIAIMADLQGPKIRISCFKKGAIFLKKNALFILDADLDEEEGDECVVGIDYKELPRDVHSGDSLLLDDGRIVLKVKKIQKNKIFCRVEVGGKLSDNKGINRKGGGLSAIALTEKDKKDLKIAVKLDADYIAISFPRSAADINLARSLLKKAKGHAGLIAKIERSDAIPVIDEIIRASDAVMVARGDLGVEIGDAELPAVQKHIIQRARSLDKAVITATQMMESMIHSAIPTRAEVFDVANAVLDGTDAVMLSAETAIGDHPALVVEAMARICLGAEKQAKTRISRHRVECQFSRPDEAIAMAAMYTANHYDIKAIIALTESGATPLWMSRIRSGLPIYGLAHNLKTTRRLALYRGVYPLYFNIDELCPENIAHLAIKELKKHKILKKGEHVLITYGDLLKTTGGTNTLKILEVD